MFVTHDFDEAVKLGDRIAVLGNQSRILQFDTPEAVLANPADDTVAGFVGAGAALKQLTLMRVRDIELSDVPVMDEDQPVESMNAALGDDPEAWGIILDARKRPIRWTDRRHLTNAKSLRDVGVPMGEMVSTQSTLQDALEALLAEGNATATVTGQRGEDRKSVV